MARGWIAGARWTTRMVVVAGLLATGGCAIHTQGPIREIAYDFSDRDFYDRAYAPSPKYLETDPLPESVGAAVAASPARGATRLEAAPARSFPQGIRRPRTVTPADADAAMDLSD